MISHLRAKRDSLVISSQYCFFLQYQGIPFYVGGDFMTVPKYVLVAVYETIIIITNLFTYLY